MGTTNHILHLTVEPNGPKHQVTLQTCVVSSREVNQEFRSSKPVLSFGVIKKPGNIGAEGFNNTEVIPSVFPVESDRSLVQFFNIEVGDLEEQTISLRNSTLDPVCLALIIRDCDSFYI